MNVISVAFAYQEDYVNVKNAFAMHIFQDSTKETSHEIICHNNEIGVRSLVHQLPTFSYIRIQGFSTQPYKLPRYPTDKMVLLEITRQLTLYEKALKEKRMSGIEFLNSIGENKVEM